MVTDMAKPTETTRLKAGQLAELLGESARTVHRWADEGRLPEPERTLSQRKLWDPRVVRDAYKASGAALPARFAAFMRRLDKAAS